MIHHTIEHKTRHSLIFDPRLYDSLNFGTLWYNISYISEDSNGEEVYLRGCIKGPGDQNLYHRCQTNKNIGGFTNIKRCYCDSNECNGAGDLKGISFFTALCLSGTLYFLMKY